MKFVDAMQALILITMKLLSISHFLALSQSKWEKKLKLVDLRFIADTAVVTYIIHIYATLPTHLIFDFSDWKDCY